MKRKKNMTVTTVTTKCKTHKEPIPNFQHFKIIATQGANNTLIIKSRDLFPSSLYDSSSLPNYHFVESCFLPIQHSFIFFTSAMVAFSSSYLADRC